MARQVGATARFSDKVAVVTGGANGIGRATALRLAADGAKVAVLDNEDEPLQAVANTIATEIGGSVLALHVDLTEQAAVIHAFETVGGELGEVDILVNNVGQTARALSSEFWESEPETWDFVLDVSLKTTLMCSRQVVPGMRARAAGKIVNTASDAALIGDAGIADYSAAKGGVISFTRSLARELAAFKVNVNAVCPGPTKTRGPMSVPGVLERAVAQIPMGEMCEPEDIANAIAFLASNEARFVTGQILAVNGGRVFH